MESVLGELGDLHSHLIPGVDDGAQTVEDSLDAVDRMVRAGVRRIVTTPHLNASLMEEPDDFEARLEEVDRAWQKVSSSVSKKFSEVEFHRGYEVAVDTPSVDFSDERLRMANTSFVLIEWPRLHVPPRTEPVLDRICGFGVRPVIAHPERYGGMDLDLAGRWRESGAYLQVNHGSLTGRYGKDVRDTAMELLKRGWVDYLSSDFHARPHLEPYIREAREALEDVGAEEQFSMLTSINPARLLKDEEPLPVPPLFASPGLWDRVKELLGGDGRRSRP